MEKEHIRYSEQDHAFLLDLHDYTFLDFAYVRDVVYQGRKETYVYNRITRLEKNGYIKKHKIPLQQLNKTGNAYNVFCLDRKGHQEVQQLLGDEVPFKKMEYTPLGVYHTLQCAHVSAAFRQNQHPDFSVVEWLSEQRSFYQYGATASQVIRPDGILTIENMKTGNAMGLMVEMERSRTRIDSTLKKLVRYDQFFEKGEFPRIYEKHPSHMRVVFISMRENELKRLMAHSISDPHLSFRHVEVLYTTYEEVLRDPWGKVYRALGHSPEKTFHFYEVIPSNKQISKAN